MKWSGLALLVWLVPASLQAQPTVSVGLGVDVITPGERVFLAVTLTTTDDPQVGKVFFEMSFPRKLLSFIEATKGRATETAGGEIKTQLRDSEGKIEESILRVDVSASRTIPPGVLVKLAFDVSKEAKADSQIKLKNLKLTAQSLEGQPLEARGSDGSITVVSEAPVSFACFFYMH